MMSQLQVVQGVRAKEFYDWFEAMKNRAAQMGLALRPLTIDELRRFA